MSMKNKDTWEFAHKYCGKVWYVCGMVMLPITVIFMLLVIGKKNEDCVGSIGGIICAVQLIPLIGSILPTEIALKKRILIRMEQDDKFQFKKYRSKGVFFDHLRQATSGRKLEKSRFMSW